MNKPQKEPKVEIIEVPLTFQQEETLKVQDTPRPNLSIKKGFHNFNNNRAYLLTAYLTAISVFAISFCIADLYVNENFLTGNKDSIDYLYFSVVTITTLGYGEMLPGTWVAKLMVAGLTIFGLYVLGMFLTASGNHINKKDREAKDGILLLNSLEPLNAALNNYISNDSDNYVLTTRGRVLGSRQYRLRKCNRELIIELNLVLELIMLSENSAVINVKDAINRFLESSRFFSGSEEHELTDFAKMMFEYELPNQLNRVLVLKKAVDTFLD